jgi:prepilin-type N-terminal cleavage/methylation domain-containing protein
LRLRERLRGERGYTLVEMITVMLIMAIVMTGITTVFVQGSNAELDMNSRFQAQTNARVALDKIRKDIHCASAVTAQSTTSVTFTDPCINATASNLTWCTATVSGNTGLYRNTGSTCSSSSPSIRFIDRLTTTTVFTYQAPVIVGASTGTLPLEYVKLPVNTNTAKHLSASVDTYTLCDGIVLRNAARGGAVGGSFVTSPC